MMHYGVPNVLGFKCSFKEQSVLIAGVCYGSCCTAGCKHLPCWRASNRKRHRQSNFWLAIIVLLVDSHFPWRGQSHLVDSICLSGTTIPVSSICQWGSQRFKPPTGWLFDVASRVTKRLGQDVTRRHAWRCAHTAAVHMQYDTREQRLFHTVPKKAENGLYCLTTRVTSHWCLSKKMTVHPCLVVQSVEMETCASTVNPCCDLTEWVVSCNNAFQL